MKKIKFRNIISAFVAVFTLACSLILPNSHTAFAAEDQPEYRMDITPTQKNWENFQPGQVYEGSFKVINRGKQDFNYEVEFSPYNITNENYDVDYATETQYTEIAKWIEVDKAEGFIASGDSVELKYRITVPDDAHGGAQVGVIMVTMQNSGGNSGTGVETIRQLGYLVYGNVDGQVTKTGKILENKIPSFLFNPPIYSTSLVENTGNVYTRATYKLQVFPLFSDEEVYTNEETPENNIIFPETKRLNQISWDGAPQLGIFRVKSTVKIFDEESVTEKIVFLCPIWFLFVVILMIILIIFWIVSRIIGRKREV